MHVYLLYCTVMQLAQSPPPPTHPYYMLSAALIVRLQVVVVVVVVRAETSPRSFNGYITFRVRSDHRASRTNNLRAQYLLSILHVGTQTRRLGYSDMPPRFDGSLSGAKTKSSEFARIVLAIVRKPEPTFSMYRQLSYYAWGQVPRVGRQVCTVLTVQVRI